MINIHQTNLFYHLQAKSLFKFLKMAFQDKIRTYDLSFRRPMHYRSVTINKKRFIYCYIDTNDECRYNEIIWKVWCITYE